MGGRYKKIIGGMDGKMTFLLDIEKELSEAKKKRTKEVILSVFLCLAYLIFLSVSIAFSGDHYLIIMWISIVLGAALAWWLIYYLSVVVRRNNAYLRFFENATHGEKKEEIIHVVSSSKEPSFSKEGMDASMVKGSFKEDGKVFERDLYLISDGASFKEGEKVKVTSFSSVILSYEVLS